MSIKHYIDAFYDFLDSIGYMHPMRPAKALASHAALCREAGPAPIAEPEALMEATGA